MPHAVCVALAFVLALQAGAQPLLLGNAAARITPDDLSAIARVVGEPTWLMRIENHLRPAGGSASRLETRESSWTATAYLMPDREAPQLREGRVMPLTNTGAQPDPSQWSRVLRGQTTTKWVQVRLPGRLWTDVRSTDDPNWPIGVSGELSDSDLISLVEFVRSGPVQASGSRGGRGGVRLAPDRRISSITVDATGRLTGAGDRGGASPVSVTLTTNSPVGCQDVLRLERFDGQWTAIYVGGACG
jgi:hypothetical protein